MINANQLDREANSHATHATSTAGGLEHARALRDAIREYRTRANNAGQNSADTNNEIAWTIENALAAATTRPNGTERRTAWAERSRPRNRRTSR